MSTVPQIISTEFIALYSEIQKLEEQLAKSQQIQSNLKNNISVISKKYHKAVSLIKSKTKNIDFAKEDCLSKSHNKLIITTIANINPIKGIENIIKAASIVNKHINNVEFYIVGQISKRQKKYF